MKSGEEVKFYVLKIEGTATTDTKKGVVLALYDNGRYARIRSEDGKVFDLPVESLTSSRH